MRLLRVVALAALCLASAAGGYLAYRHWVAAPPSVSDLRPDLTFRDLEGQPRKLSEWDGKLQLLNFWATWCTPCLKEIPLLVEAQKAYGMRGLQIVGLAADQVEPVRQFRDRFGINYPLLAGEADIFAGMDALGDTLGALPFSVLVGRDGRILARVSGDFSREELEELIGEHL